MTARGRPWVLSMRWQDVLFAHWPIDPAELADRLPRGLELDVRDGVGWVGVVPFTMSRVRLRGLPPLPGSGAFAEVNVRTYVRAGGRAGVWFLSLDADSRLAVRVARAVFHVPYLDARFAVRNRRGEVDYGMRRSATGDGAAELRVRYRPAGPLLDGTDDLATWLTDRDCAFAADAAGRLLRIDVDHRAWPLRNAEAAIETETLLAAAGIRRPDTSPRLHVADRLDVRFFLPTPVSP